MFHRTLEAAQPAPSAAILAFNAETASAMLARMSPEDRALGDAFDAHYGKGNWFITWDEDLCGKPIRGTVAIGHGKDVVIIG